MPVVAQPLPEVEEEEISQIVPLVALQNDVRYQGSDEKTKQDIYNRWEEDTQRKMNDRGLWDPTSSLEFEIETRRERQRLVGMEPMSREATVAAMREDAANDKTPEQLENVFSMLDEVETAESERRRLDRSKFFTLGDESGIDMDIDEQGKLVESATFKAGGDTTIKGAREALAAMQGQRDTGVVKNNLFVNPELYLDKAKFLTAVSKSGATGDEKRRVISQFDHVRDSVLETQYDYFNGQQGFVNFAEKKLLENPDTDPAEMILMYQDSFGAKGSKVLSSLSKGYLSGMKALVGLGSLALDAAGVTENAVGETSEFFQNAEGTFQESVDRRGGAGFGLQVTETVGALAPQVATAALGGSFAQILRGAGMNLAAKSATKTLTSRLAGKGLKKLAIQKFANRKLALNEYTNLLNKASAFGSAGLSSAGPKFYESYERNREKFAAQGLVGEELEGAARSAAISAANRTGLITAGVTSIFGLSGVEGVGRLFQVAGNPVAREAMTSSLKTFAKKTALGGLGEGFEEALDEGINGGLDALLENPDMSFDDWVEATLFAGTVGALIGGAIEVPVAAHEVAVRKAAEAIEKSPQMAAKRDAVKQLRDEGLEEAADALEKNNVVSQQKAVEDSAEDIGDEAVASVERLAAVDTEIAELEGAGELDGEQAAKLDVLKTERSDIQETLGQGGGGTGGEVDILSLGNQARAELVDQGMDPVEAGRRIAQVQKDGNDLSDLSVKSLATVAREVELDLNSAEQIVADERELADLDAVSEARGTEGATPEAEVGRRAELVERIADNKTKLDVGKKSEPAPVTEAKTSAATAPTRVQNKDFKEEDPITLFNGAGESVEGVVVGVSDKGTLRIETPEGGVFIIDTDGASPQGAFLNPPENRPVEDFKLPVTFSPAAKQGVALGTLTDAELNELKTVFNDKIKDDPSLVGTTPGGFSAEAAVRDHKETARAIKAELARRETISDTDTTGQTAINGVTNITDEQTRLEEDSRAGEETGSETDGQSGRTRSNEEGARDVGGTVEVVDQTTTTRLSETKSERAARRDGSEEREGGINAERTGREGVVSESGTRDADGANTPEGSDNEAGKRARDVRSIERSLVSVVDGINATNEAFHDVLFAADDQALARLPFWTSLSESQQAEIKSLREQIPVVDSIPDLADTRDIQTGIGTPVNFSFVGAGAESVVLEDSNRPGVVIKYTNSRPLTDALGKDVGPGLGLRFGVSGHIQIDENGDLTLEPARTDRPNQIGARLIDLAAGLDQDVAALLPQTLVGVHPETGVAIFEQAKADKISTPSTKEIMEQLRVENDSLLMRVNLNPEKGLIEIISRDAAGNLKIIGDVLDHSGNTIITEEGARIVDAHIFPVTDEMLAASETLRDAKTILDFRASPLESSVPLATAPRNATPTTPDSLEQGVTKTDDWGKSINDLVDRLIIDNPSINASVDTAITQPAVSIGSRVKINPVMLAKMTEGLTPKDAQKIIEKIFTHENIHQAAVKDIGEDEVLAIASSMSIDERMDVARQYLDPNNYPDVLSYQNALKDFSGTDPRLTPNERRVASFRLGHEYLRMQYEKATAGFSTEEDIAWLSTNPGLLSRVVRYLRAALNKITTQWRLKKDITLHAQMDRLGKTIWQMQRGETFTHPGSPIFNPEETVAPAEANTVFNTLLGRRVPLEDVPLATETPRNTLPVPPTGQPLSDTDLAASPWGRKQRTPIYNNDKTPGKYNPGGWLSAAFRFDRRLHKFLTQSKSRESAALAEAEFFHAEVNRLMKKHYGKDSAQHLPTVNQALGNIDNPLNQGQVEEISRIKQNGKNRAVAEFMSQRQLATNLDQQANAPFVDPEVSEARRNQAARVREDAKFQFDVDVKAYKQAADTFENSARGFNRRQARRNMRAAEDSLPEDLRRAVRTMRVKIALKGRELMRSGLLDGDIKATISANQGMWLHRSYKIFDQDNYVDWVSEDTGEEASLIRNNALNYIRAALVDQEVRKIRAEGQISIEAAQLEAHAAVTDEKVRDQFNDYLSVADEGAKNMFQGSAVSKNTEILLRRGVIPEEIQALWGANTDPTLNAAKSLASITQYVETQRFFERVKKLGLEEGWLSEGNRDAQGNRLVPLFDQGMVGRFNNTPNPRFAPLAGLNGPPALRDAFADVSRNEAQWAWVTALTKATGYSMMTKTVLSWQATMRNFLGNILFMVANGHLNFSMPSSIIRHGNIAWDNFRRRGTRETRDRINRLTELGVIGESVAQNLINDMTNGFDSDKKAIKFVEKNLQKTFIRGLFEKVKTDAPRFYGSQDDFWKMVAFENELVRVKKYRKGSGKTDVELEEEAADIIRNTMPTYSLAPEAIQALKRIPFIAPFVTFSSEVYRTTGGLLKLGSTQLNEGLRTGNSELTKAGAQRLFGFAMATGGLYGVLAVAREAAGFDEEDEENLRQHIPYWEENSSLLLLPSDKKGEIKYWNISYMNPYDVWTRPFRALARGAADPDSGVLDTFASTAGELLDPVAKEQILFGSIMDAMRGVTDSGRSVYDKTDPLNKRIVNSLWHVVNSALVPGTATSIERVRKGWVGAVSTSGKQFVFKDELGSALFGVKISTANPEASLQFAARQFNFDRRDAAATFTKLFKSPGTQSDAAIRDSYVEANTKLRQAHLNLRKKLISAIELGAVTPSKAASILQANRLGKESQNALLSNRYLRYQPTKATLRRAVLNGNKLGQDRISLMREAMQEVPALEVISEDDENF